MQLGEIDCQPLSHRRAYGWLRFYLLVLLYLARHFRELTLLDNVHLPIHQGGHLVLQLLRRNAPSLRWNDVPTAGSGPARSLLCHSAPSSRNHVLVLCFLPSSCRRGHLPERRHRTRPLLSVTAGAIANESDHGWYNIFTACYRTLSRSVQPRDS